jgi:hypothetical protein
LTEKWSFLSQNDRKKISFLFGFCLSLSAIATAAAAVFDALHNKRRNEIV